MNYKSTTVWECWEPAPARRKLLAKVCLVREEIENVDRQRQISRTGTVLPFSPANGGRQGVPRRAVAFLKVIICTRLREAPIWPHVCHLQWIHTKLASLCGHQAKVPDLENGMNASSRTGVGEGPYIQIIKATARAYRSHVKVQVMLPRMQQPLSTLL